jgi:hypothetical protein
MIGHACKNENNTYKDGQAGDQTKVEVYIRTWYNRPWNVILRAKDNLVREKIATAMELACKNEHIGYSQATRNSLWNNIKSAKFDPSKTTKEVNTDCSALVCVCCAYAGVPIQYLQIGNNSLTTSTLRKYLLQSGMFEAITDKEYLINDKNLLRGDILLYEGHHTAVNLNDGINAKKTTELKSLDEIAQEVLDGKWGNEPQRRIDLINAGYNYALVKAKVNEILKAKQEVKQSTDNSNAKIIWDYLMKKINNPYGVAGLMGNLQAESGLNPKNLQNSCEKKSGYTDQTYTLNVDNGTYTNFTNDKYGYGICQWTSSGRKLGLMQFKGNKSIGDLTMQLDYLWKELNTSYKIVLNTIKSAKSVKEASDIVLTKFERPKDQSDAVKIKRASYGQYFFDKYNK